MDDVARDDMRCACAAEGGQLETLKWAREHGCPWEENLEDLSRDCCALAAKGGHLETLKWLRENECPWNGTTCAWTAWRGNLEVLRWAREHGCEWDEVSCCSFAAECGRLEVLK
jgi:hypothetical protein